MSDAGSSSSVSSFETCRVSCQNKFVKLVHLVGFNTKKFVTMHGHINVKKKTSVKMAKFRVKTQIGEPPDKQ